MSASRLIDAVTPGMDGIDESASAQVSNTTGVPSDRAADGWTPNASTSTSGSGPSSVVVAEMTCMPAVVKSVTRPYRYTGDRSTIPTLITQPAFSGVVSERFHSSTDRMAGQPANRDR